MIKWKKPSGAVVETNDNPANIAAAIKLGWKSDAVGSHDNDSEDALSGKDSIISKAKEGMSQLQKLCGEKDLRIDELNVKILSLEVDLEEATKPAGPAKELTPQEKGKLTRELNALKGEANKLGIPVHESDTIETLKDTIKHTKVGK